MCRNNSLFNLTLRQYDVDLCSLGTRPTDNHTTVGLAYTVFLTGSNMAEADRKKDFDKVHFLA